MKFSCAAVIFLLLLGCAGAPSDQSFQTSGSPALSPTSDQGATQPQGVFTSVDKPTSGSAQIVTRSGKRYLELSQDFQTERGPDLFVLLHRAETPQAYKAQDSINLGSLQQVSGRQSYLIPAEVDLSQFHSAAIWCRAFNVTFGYARLGR